MKKQVFILLMTIACGIASFFETKFNFGMVVGVMTSFFILGQSLIKSDSKYVAQDEPYEKADNFLLFVGLVIGFIFFLSSVLKSFFFLWKFVSKGNYEKAFYGFFSLFIIVLPVVIPYCWKKIIKKLKSVRFGIRID